jgi:hypothetical protein
MAGDVQVGESVARRYAVLRPHLDERQRRLMLAAEAAELGRGGITVVAQVTGVHSDTVAKGVRELEGGGEPSGRVRKPGGGRKPATETDPGLAPALKVLSHAVRKPPHRTVWAPIPESGLQLGGGRDDLASERQPARGAPLAEVEPELRRSPEAPPAHAAA